MSMAVIDQADKPAWTKIAMSQIELDPEVDGFTWFAITKKENFAKRVVKWGPDSDDATKKLFIEAVLRMAK